MFNINCREEKMIIRGKNGYFYFIIYNCTSFIVYHWDKINFLFFGQRLFIYIANIDCILDSCIFKKSQKIAKKMEGGTK